MSLYYVTAIRHSADESHITHVMVHSPKSAGRLHKGAVLSKDQVILGMATNSYETATYNYTRGSWSKGAEIHVVRINGVNYLRTSADQTAKDNLGNLLLIDEIR